jgi:hypothetical protein
MRVHQMGPNRGLPGTTPNDVRTQPVVNQIQALSAYGQRFVECHNYHTRIQIV